MRFICVIVAVIAAHGLACAEQAGDQGASRAEGLEARVKSTEAKVTALQAQLKESCDLTVKHLTSLIERQGAVQDRLNAHDKDIASTKDDIVKLDRRLVFAEDKLRKLNEIEVDINGLKGDTNQLKKDVSSLKQEQKNMAERLAALEKAQTEPKK